MIPPKAASLNFVMLASKLTPLPVTGEVLCFYVSQLADDGLAHQTLKSYLSALRHMEITYGHPDPRVGDMPRLEQIMRVIKSSQARQGKKPKTCLPITPTVLHRMRDVRNTDPQNHIMLW